MSKPVPPPPTLEQLCQRACQLLGITRQQGGPVMGALLQATFVENDRCAAIVARFCLGKLPAAELVALSRLLEPDPGLECSPACPARPQSNPARARGRVSREGEKVA